MKAVATTLRIVAADDSAVVRHMLKTLFDSVAEHAHNAPPAMELFGIANDGVNCIELVRAMQPDLVLLDLEMPRMSGMEALDVLHLEFPEMPIIMCSAYTARGATATLEALAHGASDYVTKPTGSTDPMAAMASLSSQLIPKIIALVDRTRRGPNATVPHMRMPPPEERCLGGLEIVGIGASTGGPAALESLLPRLPASFQAPVVIAQHLPRLFTRELASRLNRRCRMPVRVAEQGSFLLPGTIWFAPCDVPMEIVKNAEGIGRVVLPQQSPVQQCRSVIDQLFRSIAYTYGRRALGVVLTGMGSDGLAGAGALVHAGSTVLAQDEASSAVWGMPGRVVGAGLAVAALSLESLGRELISRVEYAPQSAIFTSRTSSENVYATP